MFIIGLTGGIATGKSTVGRMLEELGGCIVDADLLSRELMAPGSAMLDSVSNIFGAESLNPDGSLNRGFVRGATFADNDKRRLLEGILHPAIRNLALERLALAESGGFGVAVYIAPLLIEAGACEMVDEIWVVTVPPEMQLKRIVARDASDISEAKRIVEAQMPLDEKLKYAAVVIENSGTIDETRKQVVDAWRQRAGGL